MGKRKALFLAGAIGMGSATAAISADLLPPPPPLDPGIAIVDPGDPSGWYIRGDAGVGSTVFSSMRSTFVFAVPDVKVDSKSFTDSAFVRFGLGYQFNNWLRADITGEYRTASSMQAIESFNQGSFFTPATADRSYDNYAGQVSHAVLMANGYVDVGTWNRITPYVGAGIGYARHTVSGLHDAGGVATFAAGQYGISGLGYAPSKSSGSLAWALMAGLGYSVNQNLKLELGYRYLNLGETTSAKITCQTQAANTCPFEVQHYKLASHDIHVGMRWMFGASGGASTSYAVSGSAPASYSTAYSGQGAVVSGAGYAGAPVAANYASGASYSSGASYASGAGASGAAYVSAPPRKRAPRKPARVHTAPMSHLDAPRRMETQDF